LKSHAVLRQLTNTHPAFSTHSPRQVLRRAAEVDLAASAWAEAYSVELDRAGLLNEQLSIEISRVRGITPELQTELESNLVDVKGLSSPKAETEEEWASVFLQIREQNKQAERGIAKARTSGPDFEFELDDGFSEEMSQTFAER